MPLVVLWYPFWRAWLWWRRELWEVKQKYILLEIIPPAETLQPLSAMEQILSSIWGVYTGIEGIYHLKKKWWWGRKLYYFCFEIASMGPYPHLLLRIMKTHQDTVEAALYSQFPEMEIHEVDDYTRYISQNVPSKDWQVYGLDEMPVKPDVYPIKTYRMFFEERPEMMKEEKRIDPLATLLEALAKLREKKEALWIQIKAVPVTANDSDYMERGKRIVDELVHRAEKRPSRTKEGMKAGEAFIPPEMKLTAKEKEVVKAIDDKIAKPAFRCNIRLLYFGHPDIFTMGRRTLGEQFFNSFSTRDLNAVKKWRKTKTRIYHFFVKRRLFLRRRRMFWRYVLRETPLYPRKGGTFILNIEELATIFHPPIITRALGTFLPRVGARKGEPPAGLPVEDFGKAPETPPSPSSEQKFGGGIKAKKGEAPPSLPTK